MNESGFETSMRSRTKITATIGPASRDIATLCAMIDAGASVFRLNFAHGTHEEHSENVRSIRAASESTGRPTAILQDLGGPKIRLGELAGGAVSCPLDQAFELVDSIEPSVNPHSLTCTYSDLPGDLSIGDAVLFADGAVAMKVVAATPNRAVLRVVQPGVLKSHQGINLPGAKLKIPALTAKDLEDLDWAAEHQIEYVGQSFVRSAEDVSWLRSELAKRRSRSKIVAKIEKPEAVDHLDEILCQTDAIMVARGDLGVEMDVARVPAAQKRIIAACRRDAIPVITATQMLTSMQKSSRPTRAEASDVFNAVLDGTDAVMLSEETAVGSYPVEAVAMMRRIALEAEAMLATTRQESGRTDHEGGVSAITAAVVEAASLACMRLNASLIVVATRSGKTALAISKQRHATPTLALADDPVVVRSMALFWGVTPLFAPIQQPEEALSIARDWARAHDLLHSGDRVVLIRGVIPGQQIHNALFIDQIP